MIDKLRELLPHISCQQATRLISESMERKLSLKEKFLVKIHLHVCDLCQTFQKQIQGLHELLRAYSPLKEQPMSLDQKDKLKGLLRKLP